MKAIYSKTDKTGQKTPCRMTIDGKRVNTELYYNTIPEDAKVPSGWHETREAALADKPKKVTKKKKVSE